MKCGTYWDGVVIDEVAPVRERGLKCGTYWDGVVIDEVAPVRERGLKLLHAVLCALFASVAPVRERGLKFLFGLQFINQHTRRSRKGAWIEIKGQAVYTHVCSCRSRKGAWIEIGRGRSNRQASASLP